MILPIRTRCNALLWSFVLAASPLTVIIQPAAAQQVSKETLFRDVRVLDVLNGRLSQPTNVLVQGNKIATIGTEANPSAGATTIDGHGRTLMPGLIDDHVHITFSSLSLKELEDPNMKPEQVEAAAVSGARDMLLRGFTAVRRGCIASRRVGRRW